MFILYANKNQMAVRRREPVTSGSVNVCAARFEFSDDWAGLERVAVFKAGNESRSVVLDEANACQVPWEVLTVPGVPLRAGVYGTRGGEVVLPTIWAGLGTILQGVAPGEGAHPPTPDLWEQELAKKGDSLAYNGLKLSLVSGGKELSSVEIAGGGGEGVLYEFGHGLKQDGVKVSVDMASKENPDKTLPISAAAVACAVGNIEVLLQTI